MMSQTQKIRSHLPEIRETSAEETLRLRRAQEGETELRFLGAARLLRQSGLFDRTWYSTTYPDVPERRALCHFLLTGGHEGRNPGPGFDSAFYLASYPDVAAAGVIPALHFAQHGRREGRLPMPPGAALRERLPHNPWSPNALSAAVAVFQMDAARAEATLAHRPPSNWLPRLPDRARVQVLVHSGGNIFMREIAELVSAAFTAAGFCSSLCDERSASPAGREAAGGRDSPLRVIVAPHEFFLLPGDDGTTVPSEWAEGAILLNVEQLHTAWFQAGLPALKRARGIFDINLQSAAALAEAGLPCAFLPLGFVPDFEAFGPCRRLPDLPALATLERGIRESVPDPNAPLGERPIDIFFIGHLSARRSGLLERMAARLARWRCHFVLTSADRPQVRGQNAALDTAATIGLAQRSKIVLNLHQSDELFFEWHRIVLQGIWQRALVVSEPVAHQPPFTAGEHFLSASPEELADLLDWVLCTPEGRAVVERVRHQAYDHLTRNVRLDQTLRALFGASATKPS